MRNKIAGLGAVAAIMSTGGSSKNYTPDWVAQKSAGSVTTIKGLTMFHQGAVVATRFAKAKTVDEFLEAEAIWTVLRPNLSAYEMSLSCKDYGAAHDNDIAIDLVEQLLKKPISLMINVTKLVLSFAGREKDETLEALKAATNDLVSLVLDEKVDKRVESILENPTTRRVVMRFREALLRYLQSHSKRSRLYFVKVINDIESIAKGYGGLALKAGLIALTPSRINPEECGSEEWIERERQSALLRVYGSKSPLLQFR